MTQVMDKRSFISLGCWVFNNVLVQPNAIIGTSGNTDDGIWEDSSEVVTALKPSSNPSAADVVGVKPP